MQKTRKRKTNQPTNKLDFGKKKKKKKKEKKKEKRKKRKRKILILSNVSALRKLFDTNDG